MSSEIVILSLGLVALILIAVGIQAVDEIKVWLNKRNNKENKNK